jgi:hypothetical protein
MYPSVKLRINKKVKKMRKNVELPIQEKYSSTGANTNRRAVSIFGRLSIGALSWLNSGLDRVRGNFERFISSSHGRE